MAAAESARPLAVVTGASAGIGAALAREFARLGHDPVLVARRAPRLEAMAEELRRDFGCAPELVVADLADPDAPERIFEAVRALGRPVGALANNAGYGMPGLFDEHDWPSHRAFIEVTATAPAHLSHLFAPGMKARGEGLILNVASLAALIAPHAGGTLYYPCKAFVLQFSLAHHEELRGSGVNVTALCPGFTRTEFQEAAGGTVESVTPAGFMWMSAGAVARAGVAAVRRGDAICVPGLVNKAIALAFKLAPEAVGRWAVRPKLEAVRRRPPG